MSMTINVMQNYFSRCSSQKLPIELLSRLLVHRLPVSTTTGNRDDKNDNDGTSPTNVTSSQLLTLSTAKQLKGDIPEAIALANRALAKQRTEDDPLAVADTSLFLGKLLQLEQRYHEAETSFKEAHSIHRSLSSMSTPTQQQSTTVMPTAHGEYKALSHLATVQKKLLRYDEAELNYLQALKGLENSVGWEDGVTNHTSFELARLYREQGRHTDARTILENMKSQLKIVFGERDARTIQINGELADVSLSVGDRLSAIQLLDEIVEELPPNSPEARKAFVRMEELKEDEEMGTEVPSGGVTVTFTTSRK